MNVPRRRAGRKLSMSTMSCAASPIQFHNFLPISSVGLGSGGYRFHGLLQNLSQCVHSSLWPKFELLYVLSSRMFHRVISTLTRETGLLNKQVLSCPELIPETTLHFSPEMVKPTATILPTSRSLFHAKPSAWSVQARSPTSFPQSLRILQGQTVV